MNVRRIRAADADPAEYLRGANEAFGNWGDEAMFRWAFRGDAELLLVDDGGATIAGSAILPRTLVDASGATRPGAIIAGSWTAAAARGRGVFARILDETAAIAREWNALLTAFGRRENASARRFDAAGAGMHRAFYCRSTRADAIRANAELIIEREPEVAALMHRRGTSFFYTPAEWRTQFIDRPHASIECVGVAGDWCALVERTTEFDRVHCITDVAKLAPLALRAHASGRRLFCYTSRESDAELLAAHGFEWTEGFIPTMPPSAFNDCDFQNGDRM